MGHITFIFGGLPDKRFAEVYGQDEQATADARLIAAAPQLYAALVEIREAGGAMSQAVINMCSLDQRDAILNQTPYFTAMLRAGAAIAKAEGRDA